MALAKMQPKTMVGKIGETKPIAAEAAAAIGDGESARVTSARHLTSASPLVKVVTATAQIPIARAPTRISSVGMGGGVNEAAAVMTRHLGARPQARRLAGLPGKKEAAGAIQIVTRHPGAHPQARRLA